MLEALESLELSLEEIAESKEDLPQTEDISQSSEPLISEDEAIAEQVTEFKFTLSLIGATIQDGGMKERSAELCAFSLPRK